MGVRQTLPQLNDKKQIKENDIPKGPIEINDIPDDQILCPYCDTVPEILNVHGDNGHVELKCSYHGVIDISIKDYYKMTKESIFTYLKIQCANCNRIQGTKDNMYKYCYRCKKDLCPECVQNFNLSDLDHRRDHLDHCIPVNEKNHKCLEHENSDVLDFCLDCNENVCDKEKVERHRGHNKKSLIGFSIDINKYEKIINEKNKILADIIRFNEIILNTYNKFKDNYFHIISLINVGKSIELENQRNSKEIDVMIQGLEKTHKTQQKAIESLRDQCNIDLNGNELTLYLRRRWLDNDKLNLISLIKFQRLKDMNISGNNISNLEALNNMNLPDLEYFNASQNQIKDITPLAELNSKKLKEICLQENIIEDFSPLLKSEFPELERLRIEKNNFDKDLDEFKKLLKKYNKKVIYIAKTIDEFNKKYGCKLDNNNEVIDLSGLRAGDDLLRELYLIINQDLKIKKLNLHNNEIKDASLLGRINLRYLEELDISLNKINNIQFVTEIKSRHLIKIYLNDNHIKDISPLIKINDANIFSPDQQNNENNDNTTIKKNFPNLSVISLKGNYLKVDDKTCSFALDILDKLDITTDKDFW